MAVTFAVGAVTGTVLTFEFGLLWPTFMGRFGAAFGIPFTIEGLFFFTEAIFVAIYIYGWTAAEAVAALLDRRADRDCRHRRCGLGGRRERVDERAARLHPEPCGQSRRRQAVERHLQQRLSPRSGAHVRRGVRGRRVPDRVGLRDGHVARAAGSLPPARLHHPVHGRGDHDADPDGRRRLARALRVTTTSRRSSRRSSLFPRRARTCRRRCSGTSTRTTR